MEFLWVSLAGFEIVSFKSEKALNENWIGCSIELMLFSMSVMFSK